MKLLIKRGRLIDPAQDLDQTCDVLIEGGVVAELGTSIEAGGAEVIDATGLVVCPGLVDMHVHLREPGREDEETIESGARAAIHGGFTSVAAMPNTEPPVEGEEGVKFVLGKAREAGLARVFPVAAISKGQKGETLSEIGSAIRAGAVGISDDGYPVAESGLMRRALEYVKMFNRPVMAHCEDPGLSARGVMNEGTTSTMLGLRGIPGASEEVEVIRDIILTRLTTSRLHVCHVSTGPGLDFIDRAKTSGINVTCEVTPHHLALTDEAVTTYDTNTKMKPPLRGKDDVAALRKGIEEGIVDAIASDHAPHSPEEKDQEFDLAPFGVIGLETTLGIVMSSLYHDGAVTLPDLIRLLSTNPARILGLPLGSLKPGSPADVTLLDPDAEWEIDPRDFVSKSRNTPFSGWKVKGKPITVMVEGRVLMRDGEPQNAGSADMNEKEQYWSIRLGKVGKALEANGIETFVADTREEALTRALTLIPKGATVGLGGSRTVQEIGLLEALRNGDYTLYDQYREDLGREESMRIRKEGTHADCFVSGSNAITSDGKIVNVDGLGNRLAGFCFGPGKVIIVVGRNKIVPDLEAALYRVRNVAAPINARRFGAKTPCVETAECSDCDSPQRICNLTLIIEKSKIEGRMKVILVNEDLGF